MSVGEGQQLLLQLLQRKRKRKRKRRRTTAGEQQAIGSLLRGATT